ncbi:GNAT family N-acetyltransferase [Lewinellaceae bacterium SD302]|nr:GNAT family N-acetyltransferase [Lewinellaceae bacterium SD302]
MEAVRIVNNEVKKRFETTVDGHLGVVEYKRLGDKIALIHTGVPDEIGGRGIASQLAKYALDFARDNSLKVLPYCPFIARYIKEHPEYEDLVDEKMKG